MGLRDRRSETVEVVYPTVGRVVHLRLDVNSDPDAVPVLRPALVLGRGKDQGFLRLQVFLFPTDLTEVGIAAGSRIFQREGCHGYFAAAPFGDDCGEWRWPEIAGDDEDAETFFA